MMTWLPQAAATVAVLAPGALAAWFSRKAPGPGSARNWGVTPGPDPDYAFAGDPR